MDEITKMQTEANIEIVKKGGKSKELKSHANSGSAMTYARRYAYLALAGIASEDEDAVSLGFIPDRSPLVTDDQAKELQNALNETNSNQAAMLNMYKVKTISSMRQEHPEMLWLLLISGGQRMQQQTPEWYQARLGK